MVGLQPLPHSTRGLSLTEIWVGYSDISSSSSPGTAPGSHLHIPGCRAVVGPTEDLCHVPQDIDGGEQVAAVAGAVLRDLQQGLDDLRDSLPWQPTLSFGQVLSGLGGWRGLDAVTAAGHRQVGAGGSDAWRPPQPQPHVQRVGAFPGAPGTGLTIIWMFR